ncbi:MAG: long-chain fatty acid--CoA ligase [Deltaproteobacteria bacterium]|nr:long-chain fatty acid--CoA ligase [Deltaproteobacteria bacterium]
MQENKPWLKFYGDVPHTVDYPKTSMYEALMLTVEESPDNIAYDFLGITATYKEFAEQIDRYADAFAALGLSKGDKITIAMPTSPPGVAAFYAANKLGAVSSMIHPLSTESEVEFYVTKSKSKMALTLDMFFTKFNAVMRRTNLETLVIVKMQNFLPMHLKTLYWLKAGRKNPRVKNTAGVKLLSTLLKAGFPKAPKADVHTDDMAVILYSGGTTGKPKGIMLSNYNFISEGLMVANWAGLDPDYPKMLATLPIFHGFGLGVCINTMFMAGGTCIMLPRFEPDQIAKIIQKKQPNYLIGPPTLYAALNKNQSFNKTDLSCLKATFCGADTLPRVVKEDFEKIVQKQGGNVKLLEGYGLTEAVTAIMATPIGGYRDGSIGVPFPDMRAKIVKRETIDDAPVGEEGEICVEGPAVMLGYLDEPEETANTIKVHADGKKWLHTGDIGTMDEDGFFYFKLREKRMIKSSGMNVYPAQVEDQLYKHELVGEACVIGVPDKTQVERVKAFVVLKDKSREGPEMARELITHCTKDLIKWSCPRDIEFRDELPQTLVGKIAYKVLEEQEVARLKADGKYYGEN